MPQSTQNTVGYFFLTNHLEWHWRK